MIKIIELNKVSSTMDIAFNILKTSEQHSCFAVFSHEQYKGRGKFQRKFYSPLNQGIYLTIVIKASTLPKNIDLDLIPIISAVTTQKIIQKFSKSKIKFKWVNDLYILNKKIGGILCEYKIINGTKYLFIGIGVNITQKVNYNYPITPNNKIGYISNDKFDLKNSIYKIVSGLLLALHNSKILKSYINYYISNQVLKPGMLVTLSVGLSKIKGQFIKVTPKGTLVIKEKSKLLKVRYGEIKKLSITSE